MVPPWIVDAPMNARRFETWIETQLAPELQPGDIVILDNVGFHKSQRAAELVRKRGAWLLFLPPSRWRSRNSRRCCARRLQEPSTPLCHALGEICELFDPTQCRNFFKAAGYEAN